MAAIRAAANHGNTDAFALLMARPRPMRPPLDTESTLKGIVGTVSPLLGVLTSLQEKVEWHLRIASLPVGLLVGVLSLIGLWRKVRGR